MKNLFLVLSVVLVGGMVQLSAQSCSHAKASKSCSSSTASVSPAAIKAAEMDPSIEKKVCEKSGKVSFYRNSSDANGVLVSTEVVYDEGKAMFVNYTANAVSEGTGNAKACCSGKAAKACCSKKGAKSCSSKAENTAPAN